MKYSIFSTIVTVALLGAACGGATPVPADSVPATLVPVRIGMGFIPDIQFAPYYVAEERGYYAAEGLAVTFETLFENDSLPLIGAGELDFANASPEAVIQARSQDLPVVYVMKWFEKYPIAVVSKAEQGITTPSDLAGRTVGLPGLWGASYIGWRALLASQGMPEDAAQLEAIDFTQVPSLAEDKVEVVVGYANNEPVQLQAQGIEVNVLYVSDYVALASNGLVTSETFIAERPEMVAGMVRATLRGLADVIADPDAAYEVSLDYVEGLDQADRDTILSLLAASIDIWQTDQPGISQLEPWETTQATLLAMGLITEPINVSEAFTNEFVQP
ncbi:MAG: ABC transporter substrate-binding protein [Anaerolineales bacterium]